MLDNFQLLKGSTMCSLAIKALHASSIFVDGMIAASWPYLIQVIKEPRVDPLASLIGTVNTGPGNLKATVLRELQAKGASISSYGEGGPLQHAWRSNINATIRQIRESTIRKQGIP